MRQSPSIPEDLPHVISDALSASKLVGEIDGQRAWLAERRSPYAAPGVSVGLMQAAFIAHCCILLRKLAEAHIKRTPGAS